MSVPSFCTPRINRAAIDICLLSSGGRPCRLFGFIRLCDTGFIVSLVTHPNDSLGYGFPVLRPPLLVYWEFGLSYCTILGPSNATGSVYVPLWPSLMSQYAARDPGHELSNILDCLVLTLDTASSQHLYGIPIVLPVLSLRMSPKSRTEWLVYVEALFPAGGIACHIS